MSCQNLIWIYYALQPFNEYFISDSDSEQPLVESVKVTWKVVGLFDISCPTLYRSKNKKKKEILAVQKQISFCRTEIIETRIGFQVL